MLSSACPLQALELIDCANQLALNRGFVAEDSVKVSAQGQTKMILNCLCQTLGSAWQDSSSGSWLSGSRLCFTLGSDPDLRRRPSSSLPLLRHQNANRSSTSKLLIETSSPHRNRARRTERRPVFTISLRSPHLGDTQVISVRSRGRIVDDHRRSTQRGCTVLHLHPVSIACWRKELMHDRLV